MPKARRRADPVSAATEADASARSARASRNAVASPTAPATSWVPLRRSRSCPPPCCRVAKGTRGLTASAPVPTGPPTLCALSDTRSAPAVTRARSRKDAAWTASVNTAASGASRRTASTTSETGSTTPVSLLAVMTATRITSEESASANASSSTMPRPSTGSSRTSAPARAAARADSSTAGCSTAECSRTARPLSRSAASATPSTARLADSVPPEVKTTSPGSRPRKAATSSRASSSRRRPRWAGGWLPVGFPSGVAWTSAIAARTSGRSGVVAALSRYVVTPDPAESGGATAGQAIQTVLALANSLRPSSESSRP